MITYILRDNAYTHKYRCTLGSTEQSVQHTFNVIWALKYVKLKLYHGYSSKRIYNETSQYMLIIIEDIMLLTD